MKTNIIFDDFLMKDECNKIVKSNLCQYSSQSIESGYSLKYVSSGVELYNIDGEPYHLKENFALMVNPNQSLEVRVKSENPVKGLCCFIDKKIINQVVHTYQKTISKLLDDYTLDFDVNYFFNHPIHIYGTSLSKIIFNIENTSQNNQITYDKEDLFFLLAENIGFYYSITKKGLSNLKCDKPSTRKELFKRIQAGRIFINDNLQNASLKLNDIASASYLSEYHFHRSFRTFFHITPNQYIHNNRMELAWRLISSKKYNVDETCQLSGYNDTKYFNKIFKRWCIQNQKYELLYV